MESFLFIYLKGNYIRGYDAKRKTKRLFFCLWKTQVESIIKVSNGGNILFECETPNILRRLFIYEPKPSHP